MPTQHEVDDLVLRVLHPKSSAAAAKTTATTPEQTISRLSTPYVRRAHRRTYSSALTLPPSALATPSAMAITAVEDGGLVMSLSTPRAVTPALTPAPTPRAAGVTPAPTPRAAVLAVKPAAKAARPHMGMP